MSIVKKLEEFKQKARLNDHPYDTGEVVDLSKEVEILCDVVDVLCESVSRMPNYHGIEVVKFSNLTMDRVKTMLKARDE
jgi:hypothetical protein